jgi:hypothetical protein
MSVFAPYTQLDLSLAECFLEGAGIGYVVRNRHAFSVFGIPPVPFYSDAQVFVASDDFEDAHAILASLDAAAQDRASLGQRARAIAETYVFGQFVPSLRSSPCDRSESEPDV